MCGCNGKPAGGGEGYTKAKDGRWVRDDVMTGAAMALSGFPRTPAGGIVRWAGVDWYGVPYPLRLLLWKRGKITHPSRLPGCGCIRSVKDAWESVRLMFTGDNNVAKHGPQSSH